MTRQKYFRYGVVHFCSKSDEKGKLELKLNTPYKKEVNFFTFADLFLFGAAADYGCAFEFKTL